MKQIITFLFMTCLLITTGFADDLQIVQVQNLPDNVPEFAGFVPGQIVVKLNPELLSRLDKERAASTGRTGLAALDRLNARLEVAGMIQRYPNFQPREYQGRIIDPRGWFTVTYRQNIDPEQAAREYRLLNGILDAQPIGVHRINARIPNDPNFSSQWHLNQSNDADIDAPDAWDIETGNEDIIVAILDTGVRYYHKDLGGANASPSNVEAARGNMWINYAELNGTSGVDDDGNGYVDDWIGWDFVTGKSGISGEDVSTPDNDPRDFNGHGTHTTGIVAAINDNDYGVSSVAGGWNNGSQAVLGNGVKVMPLRIGWSGRYFIFEVGYVDMGFAADAFYYAANNGARIASCSWGSSNSGGVGDAIDYFLASGGLIFKAAGNDDNESTDYMTDRSDIIAVAATNSSDQKASFSSYGSWVDISAPGDNILSTYHDHNNANNDVYASLSGTSMASPMAAGVAALIWSRHPDWNATQVKQRLFDSADNIDFGSYNGKMGVGRVNAFNAVNDGSGAAPVAQFSGSPTSGDAPLTVNFTDQSSNNPTSWSWDFGDGGTSTAQNPAHTYNSAGTYTVSLTVTNSFGSDTETKIDYITVTEPVGDPPVAEFSASPTSGDAPLTVNFTDQSSNNPTSWSWDFGDGGTSTAQNPAHTYNSAGTYTVSLTVTNSFGSDTETKVNYITVNEAAQNAMHVSEVTVTKQAFWRFYQGVAKVRIVDAGGSPVADATVNGTWSGAVSGSAQITTGSDGYATSNSSWTRSDGTFTFCVNNVTKSGWIYDEAANVVTCGSSDGSSSAVPVTANVRIEDLEEELGFTFASNSPNPFNPSTTINFYIPSEAGVRVEIFNVLGQRIRTLYDGSMSAGFQSLLWNADDEYGNKVSSGFYFYQITYDQKDSLRRKILLMK